MSAEIDASLLFSTWLPKYIEVAFIRRGKELACMQYKRKERKSPQSLEISEILAE